MKNAHATAAGLYAPRCGPLLLLLQVLLAAIAQPPLRADTTGTVTLVLQRVQLCAIVWFVCTASGITCSYVVR
jgi:hypothetical protein